MLGDSLWVCDSFLAVGVFQERSGQGVLNAFALSGAPPPKRDSSLFRGKGTAGEASVFLQASWSPLL